MKNSLNSRIFLFIFIIAAIIRFSGSFSYVEKRTPAEGNILSNSIFMWERNTLEQKEFAYPSLYYFASFTTQKIAYYTLYLMGVYPPVEEFLYSVHFWNNVYATGRTLSIIFTLLIFIFLFKLARDEFDETTGVIASLFLAFSYIDVINSRLAKPDSLANLMVFLSVFMSIKYFKERKSKFMYLASLFIGLSVSSKYFFISAVPLCLAIILNQDRFSKKIKNLFIAGGLSILFFIFTCPYCIIDYREVIKTFTGAQNFVGGYIVPVHNTYILVFKDLLHYTGYAPFFLFLAGAVIAFKKRWKTHTILLSFFAVYIFMLCISKVYGARYLVYLLPYISLYAAYALVQVFRKRAIVLPLAFLLVLPTAIPSIKAVSWLSQGNTNIEIMNDFIENSLPESKLIVSYHAYRLTGRKYINYPKFVSSFKKPMFFIFGFYEDYFCWKNSKYLPWCRTLNQKLANYNPVIVLKKHNIPEYVFDYPLTLYKKNFPPESPTYLYPALVKLMGNSNFMFPGNFYVKDTEFVSLIPYRSYSKKYFSNGTGEICVMVQKKSSGTYNVIMPSGKRKNLSEKVFYKCETPNKGTGKILVKSGKAFVEVLFTTSPINLAQVLMVKAPERALTFLKSLSKNRFYSFEAKRLLIQLLIKKGKKQEALNLYKSIAQKTKILSLLFDDTFRKTYRKNGFDGAYIKLSQRIYPEFSRNSKESQKFLLFPGTYRFNKKINGFLKSEKGTLYPITDVLNIEEPGWYSIVLDQDTIPIKFYLYFDPENTLKFELRQLKLIGENLK